MSGDTQDPKQAELTVAALERGTWQVVPEGEGTLDQLGKDKTTGEDKGKPKGGGKG